MAVARQLGHRGATLVLKRYARYVPNTEELLKAIAVVAPKRTARITKLRRSA